MVDTCITTLRAVTVGIEGTIICIVDSEEHFTLVVTTNTGSNIIAGVGGGDVRAVEEVFCYNVGTEGTTV